MAEEAAVNNTIALVSAIQRFSLDDGPGIRTAVFFQGCSLCCPWCHNPEAIPVHPVLLYYEQRCRHCGRCAGVCPSGAHTYENVRHIYGAQKCRQTLACADVCPAGALAVSGKEYTLQQLMAVLQEDADFYRASAGGVTLTGGEPLLQADFIWGLAKQCAAANISLIVETAGQVPLTSFQKLLPFVKTYYFDLKGPDQDGYAKVGGIFSLVINNLRFLLSNGADVTVRIPLIPGYTADKNACLKMAELLVSLGIKKVELLPFHQLGRGKYHALCKPYAMENVPQMLHSQAEELLPAFSGLDVHIK